MMLYIPRTLGCWGDYGRILISGFCRGRENGSLVLLRTGPYVPPFSCPDGIVVTDPFRVALAERFNGLQFRPVIKKKIVSFHWEQWDKTVADVPRKPAGGEPENYLLTRRHSESVSEEIGPLWELVLEPLVEYKVEGDWRTGNRYYALRSSWNGDDFAGLHNSTMAIPLLSGAAIEFLRLSGAAEWLQFDHVTLVEKLPGNPNER